jgi:hypothetical protein
MTPPDNPIASGERPDVTRDQQPDVRIVEQPDVTTEEEAGDRTSAIRVEVTPNAIDEARSLLDSTQRLVERADTKTTVLAAALAAALGITLTNLPTIFTWAADGAENESRWLHWIIFSLLVASVVAEAIAAVHASLSLYPHLGAEYNYSPGTLKSGDLIYFGRLRKIPDRDIALGLKRAVEDESIVEHYAEQIRVNSQTAWNKHRHLRTSISFFLLGVTLATLAGIGWIVLAAIQRL